jgi:hypothetical protein
MTIFCFVLAGMLGMMHTNHSKSDWNSIAAAYAFNSGMQQPI